MNMSNPWDDMNSDFVGLPPTARSGACGASATRFVLDEEAFMDAIEPLPLFLTRAEVAGTPESRAAIAMIDDILRFLTGAD